MLPIPEQTTSRPAINRNFYDLDSLIGELNQPKEIINNQQPGQPGNNNQQPGASNQEPEGEPISPEVAALTGKTIAGTIDTVLGTGCSLYAKNSDPEKYQATDRQLQQLNLAWAAVAQKYNYKIEDSPWFNVGLLSVAVYLPKIQDAKKDRRFAEIDEKLQDLQRQIKENETRLNLQTQPAAK